LVLVTNQKNTLLENSNVRKEQSEKMADKSTGKIDNSVQHNKPKQPKLSSICCLFRQSARTRDALTWLILYRFEHLAGCMVGLGDSRCRSKFCLSCVCSTPFKSPQKWGYCAWNSILARTTPGKIMILSRSL